MILDPLVHSFYQFNPHFFFLVIHSFCFSATIDLKGRKKSTRSYFAYCTRNRNIIENVMVELEKLERGEMKMKMWHFFCEWSFLNFWHP